MHAYTGSRSRLSPRRPPRFGRKSLDVFLLSGCARKAERHLALQVCVSFRLPASECPRSPHLQFSRGKQGHVQDGLSQILNAGSLGAYHAYCPQMSMLSCMIIDGANTACFVQGSRTRSLTNLCICTPYSRYQSYYVFGSSTTYSWENKKINSWFLE